MFHSASAVSVVAFLAICAAVVTAFFLGLWFSALRAGLSPMRRVLPIALGMIVWLSAVLAVVGSGWLEADQRRVLVFAAILNGATLAVAFSPIGRWLSDLSVVWLVAFQGFRFPLELVLHSWVAQGVIPATMTWTGRNWDIVSGLLALIVAPFCQRWRVCAWLANGVGLVLLANVMRVAILSSAVPFGWPVVPKLALIYHNPYALIVPVCVGGALIGHIVLTRALLRKSA